MVNLAGKQTPRGPFPPRQRWRLLLLAAALGLVLVAIRETGDPRRWGWLQRMEVSANHGETGDGYFPGVNPRDLETVQDKTRFLPEEEDAWIRLLALLAKTSQATLRQGSMGPVTRLQLSEQSKEYRGKLVTIRGVIRRAARAAAPRNDDGIEGYDELWLEPNDGSGSPIVIHCLDLPKEFPRGTDLAENAEITGFYFKRWLYQAPEGLELAPVLLARTIEWSKRTPPAEPPQGVLGAVVVVGGAAVLAALAVGYIAARTGEKRKPARKDAV